MWWSPCSAVFRNDGDINMSTGDKLRGGLGLVEKGYAFKPQQQRVPMNSQHNGESPKWVVPKGTANFGLSCWQQLAALAGLNERAIGVAVINARHNSLFAIDMCAHEPELVVTHHFAKR